MVKPYPRFLPVRRARASRARAACSSARATPPRACGRRWTIPALPARTRLGPPGVDVARFTPREPEAARARPGRDLVRAAAADAPAAAIRTPPSPATRRRPPRRSPRSRPDDRLVVFVGKLIASKGVELLLAAWPLVLAREPRRAARDRRLRRVPGRAGARWPRRWPPAISTARGHARRGRARAAVARARSSPRAPDGYAAARAARPRRVGRPARPRRARRPAARRRGDGGHRARSPRRSGWSPPRPPPAARCRSSRTTPASARSRRTLSGAVPEAARPLAVASSVGADAVPRARRRAGRLARGARGRSAPPPARRSSAITRERYSWDGVARTVLAAAEGRLEGLPAP